jgi:hypothetical protein
MAEAWLTPQKKARSALEVCDMNNTRVLAQCSSRLKTWRGPWRQTT